MTSEAAETSAADFVGSAEAVLGVARAAAAVVAAGFAKTDELAVQAVMIAVELAQAVASAVLAALTAVVQPSALFVVRSADFEIAPEWVAERFVVAPAVGPAAVHSGLVVDLEAAIAPPENPCSLNLLIAS